MNDQMEKMMANIKVIEAGIERRDRKIAELELRIKRAIEFAEEYFDTVDGDDGVPGPNEWMDIVNILQGL